MHRNGSNGTPSHPPQGVQPATTSYGKATFGKRNAASFQMHYWTHQHVKRTWNHSIGDLTIGLESAVNGIKGWYANLYFLKWCLVCFCVHHGSGHFIQLNLGSLQLVTFHLDTYCILIQVMYSQQTVTPRPWDKITIWFHIVTTPSHLSDLSQIPLHKQNKFIK